MIGAKTVATLTLLLAAVAGAIGFGVLSPDRLFGRGFGALLLAGCFAVAVGTAAHLARSTIQCPVRGFLFQTPTAPAGMDRSARP